MVEDLVKLIKGKEHYHELEELIANVPIQWLPTLIIAAVERIEDKFFTESGAEKFVQHLEAILKGGAY